MHCPYCGHTDTRVIDTREIGEGIRRRRKCSRCQRRFTTYERLAARLVVVKRDGRREEFNREKLLEGVARSCHKRPAPAEAIESLVNEIEGELLERGGPEVDSDQIGRLVMERLKKLDDVAFVRFASVYRQFRDLEELDEEIQELKAWKERARQLEAQLELL